MSDIFISYAEEDRAKAQALAAILEDIGLTVWWDRKIPIGKSFEEVIQHALESAGCVIVLWSKNSIISKWVLSEVRQGFNKGILAPVLLEVIEKIPLPYDGLQAANLSGWKPGKQHSEISHLLDSVHAILKKPDIIPQPISRPRPKPRLFLIWIMLASTLVGLFLILVLGKTVWEQKSKAEVTAISEQGRLNEEAAAAEAEGKRQAIDR